MTIGLIILVVVLLLASAFCSLTEVAFFSLPISRVKAFRHSTDTSKRQIAKLLKSSQGLLVTIFMLNTIVNILVQNVFSDAFAVYEESWLLQVGIPLILVLLFGELLPKYVGLLYNQPIALRTASFYTWFQKATSLLRKSITAITNFFSRVFFFTMEVDKPLTTDELEHILDTSQGKTLVHEEEAKLLKGYMSFSDKLAVDIMIPKNSLLFYDTKTPLSRLITLFYDKNLTSVPICKGSFDNFIGTLDVTTFFTHQNSIRNGEDLTHLVFAPPFIPETTTLKIILNQFEQKNLQLAFIIDEYGGISGLITRAEIVKELLHESLPVVNQAYYSKAPDGAIIAEGTMPLDELSELFRIPIESSYHQITIAGYLTEKLGAIPPNGATYSTDTLFFRILSAESTRIRKVHIQKIEPKAHHAS